MSLTSSTVGGGRTKYKIIFLGDQWVGKSSIIDKYMKDKFEQGLNPTVGIDFHIKNVARNGKHYRIQIWDTAGQQRYRSLIPSYMKDVHCAVMVYDVTRPQTLDNIKIWNEIFQEHRNLQAIKIVVGNKTDLTAERKISKKDGEVESNKYDSKHCDLSAKNGKKLDQLFNIIIDSIVSNEEDRKKLNVIEETKQNPVLNQDMKCRLENDPIRISQIELNKKNNLCC